MGNDKYTINVCEQSDGSVAKDCEKTIIRFTNKEYILNGKLNYV